MKNEITRREFLRQACCAGVGSTAVYSTLLSLTMSTRAVAQTMGNGDDYKALVCLFMRGGNDSYNMLIPRERAEYNAYKATRDTLALDKDSLLNITDEATGRAFGIHPSMPEIRDLYVSKKLAFVCNAGTLVEPTTLVDYVNSRVKLPLGLFSHADQVMHWQTSTPDVRSGLGWLGKAGDLLNGQNQSPQVSMNISLSGSNRLQLGDSVIPYSINQGGAIEMNLYRQPNVYPFFKEAVDSMLDLEYQNVLQKAYANTMKGSIETGQIFNAAIDGVPEIQTTFPDNYWGDRLRMVARTIAARETLGLKRQTFYVQRGGWDFHDDVLISQDTLQREVSLAVGAFAEAMVELGLEDQVTLFSASDFGRTLTSNGDGSDHGWGGNQFIMGGAVSGGRFFGEYPNDLSLGNPLDTGRGRLIPTTSIDEYFAELSLWLGVDKSDLATVLPNLDRFYDLGSNDMPLGIFS